MKTTAAFAENKNYRDDMIKIEDFEEDDVLENSDKDMPKNIFSSAQVVDSRPDLRKPKAS